MSGTRVILVDELTKVLPNSEPTEGRTSYSILEGEDVCFQIAWRTQPTECGQAWLTLTLRTQQQAKVAFANVLPVPVTTPYFVGDDDGYLAKQPTLIPDVLRPLEATPTHSHMQRDATQGASSLNDEPSTLWTVRAQRHHDGWNSVWVTVTNPGTHLSITASTVDGPLMERTITVHTVPTTCPPPAITHTRWFHCDSLARYYDVEIWSEEHWHAIDTQMAAARKMQVNSLLMPLWTAPLDTAPGMTRTPTQLLDIARNSDGSYSIDTTRALRWIELMKKNGITHVEVPHFFTQWGAQCCAPFYIRDEDDPAKQPRLNFGWEIEASDPDYRRFLEYLIRTITEFLTQHFPAQNIIFHISDEPAEDNRHSYEAARNSIIDLLDGYTVVDALSDPHYTNLVSTPIVATHAIPAFRDANIDPTWVYYCVVQETQLANQFIAQRPNRHRQLGFQLYKARAQGFLQWGYNFYNSQLSLGDIDPFWQNDAGGGFISGDPFIVYPGPHGHVWESLRHRMVGDGFRDLAACQFAEQLIGRSAVLNIIDPDNTLDYNAGWINESEIISRRETLNSAIERALENPTPTRQETEEQ